MPTSKSSQWEKDEAYDAGWGDGFGSQSKYASIPAEYKDRLHLTFSWRKWYEEGYGDGFRRREIEKAGSNGNR